MRKLSVLLFVLVMSLASFGQAKPSDAWKKADGANRGNGLSLERDSLNQNSPLLSISDVNEFIGLMAKKFTVEQLQQFQELAKFLDERTKQRVTEYYQKPKK
jgi:hypothetical protein